MEKTRNSQTELDRQLQHIQEIHQLERAEPSLTLQRINALASVPPPSPFIRKPFVADTEHPRNHRGMAERWSGRIKAARLLLYLPTQFVWWLIVVEVSGVTGPSLLAAVGTRSIGQSISNYLLPPFLSTSLIVISLVFLVLIPYCLTLSLVDRCFAETICVREIIFLLIEMNNPRVLGRRRGKDSHQTLRFPRSTPA